MFHSRRSGFLELEPVTLWNLGTRFNKQFNNLQNFADL
jgi:hypothetical protein